MNVRSWSWVGLVGLTSWATGLLLFAHSSSVHDGHVLGDCQVCCRLSPQSMTLSDTAEEGAVGALSDGWRGTVREATERPVIRWGAETIHPRGPPAAD